MKPIVNSWTEFGDLEYICVGSITDAQYPDHDPCCSYNLVKDKFLSTYIGEQPLGPRPSQRLKLAAEELQNLIDILEAENVSVGTIQEVDADIKEELTRKRSFINPPNGIKEDKRIKKNIIQTCRPPLARFDHQLRTPWFKNNHQFCYACPRDTVITMGNTILETPTASRVRYFESNYYRDLIYPMWDTDKRIHWKTGPQPTCKDSMYNLNLRYIKQLNQNLYGRNGYKTSVNETEVAFDAADIMRVGKDIFYKRSQTANNKGLEWLRREFPEFRFHMVHFPQDSSPHLDVNLIPMRPPTLGSEGVVLINQLYPPLESEMEIFKNNEWKIQWAPLPITSNISPVAICSSSLNMNTLSINTNCCIIEECETPLYHFLEDLGWDVIGIPLRALNEFGGGIHCVTWDIRRDDAYKDYFPIQEYEVECSIDLNNFFDEKTYPK